MSFVVFKESIGYTMSHEMQEKPMSTRNTLEDLASVFPSPNTVPQSDLGPLPGPRYWSVHECASSV